MSAFFVPADLTAGHIPLAIGLNPTSQKDAAFAILEQVGIQPLALTQDIFRAVAGTPVDIQVQPNDSGYSVAGARSGYLVIESFGNDDHRGWVFSYSSGAIAHACAKIAMQAEGKIEVNSSMGHSALSNLSFTGTNHAGIPVSIVMAPINLAANDDVVYTG